MFSPLVVAQRGGGGGGDDDDDDDFDLKVYRDVARFRVALLEKSPERGIRIL